MQAISEEQGYRLDGAEEDGRTQSTSVGQLADMLDQYDDVTLFLDDLLSSKNPAQETTAHELGAIDKLVADVISRLAILSQDTSAQLELAIHDVSRTVPRLTYDLQYMRESAGAVRQSLDSVQRGAGRAGAVNGDVKGGAPTETQRVLDRMTHLDRVKTHMEEARHVLREAESWSSLEQETTAFIQSAAYDRAAERLAEAATSIQVFESAPAVYAARKELLVSLQDQLEAKLRDQLTAAATSKPSASAANGDTAQPDRSTQLKDLHRTFVLIDRESDFREAYCSGRAQEPLGVWKTAVESANAAAAIDGVPAFYTSVRQLVEQDAVLMPKIFDDPLATLVPLLERIFEEVQPSFGDLLDKVVDDRSTSALPRMIALWQGAVQFVQTIRGLLRGLPSPASPASPANANGTAADDKAARPVNGLARTHSRTTSQAPGGRRLSSAALLAPGPPVSLRHEWESTLAKVFQPFQSNYGRLEQDYLLEQMRRDVFLSDTGVADRPSDLPRIMTDRVGRTSTIISDALSRCHAFTSDLGLADLRDAIDEAYRQCYNDLDRVITAVSGSKRRPASSTGPQDELDDLGSLDYSNEDWAAFQLGLNSLQSCRRLDEMLVDAEDKLGKAISSDIPATVSPGSDEDLADVARSLLGESAAATADRRHATNRLKESRGERILALTAAAAKGFARRRQESLQQIILAPLQTLLAAYASLPIFSQPDKVNRRNDIQIPTFSPSPTDTMAQVAEGLLNLIRLFEVYASDDGLSFSLETLPFIDQDGLAEVIAAHAGASNEAKDSHQMLPTSALLSAGSHDREQATKPAKKAAPPPEIVLSSWVSSLALNLLSHLTTSVLPSLRTPLTKLGALQLATDLAYLSNAIRALDVDWEELEVWREGAECDGVDTMRDKLSRANRRNANILSKVAQLRGWTA